MNISLTKEFEKYINQKVKSGMYHSASEVIRAALRHFQEEEAEKEKKRSALRKLLQVGLNQARRGEAKEINYDELKEEIRRRSARRRKLAA